MIVTFSNCDIVTPSIENKFKFQKESKNFFGEVSFRKTYKVNQERYNFTVETEL
ncbi:hypothetical protein LEP1GSC074_3047 [Leptospira noguchii str. Hook]|uniref:Uncharacterized protein n=1 Tax=Leptospira noguchii serovar Autumnalis str. ZUN142 TaxID=1085540 RepID=M6UEJ8_9LEPT|nr:hypothetical protein LEP1GSC041_2558 [Leptospira noguchii str. 2006001870]EMO39489.1 hypothetical protein LEP1GSC186_1176 [Leptospira noguchii serovar Autumnalis str. ZUN142]EMS86174.1 hypothetical protein LEP1GSC074_3047 [Leptospira noguchii str. Hook]